MSVHRSVRTKQNLGFAPELPESHLERCEKLGLHIVRYRRESVAVEGGREKLPRDIIGKDGNTLIIWRSVDDHYNCDGYEPWHSGMFGGRYKNIHSALGWVEQAIEIKAGRATHF